MIAPIAPLLRHSSWPVASRQHPGAVAQHAQIDRDTGGLFGGSSRDRTCLNVSDSGSKLAKLNVVLGGLMQGRRDGGRSLGDLAVVFGVPFRAGATHIVQVGPVGAAGRAGGAPQLAQFVRQIMPHGNPPFQSLLAEHGDCKANVAAGYNPAMSFNKRKMEDRAARSRRPIGTITQRHFQHAIVRARRRMFRRTCANGQQAGGHVLPARALHSRDPRPSRCSPCHPKRLLAFSVACK